MPMNTTFVSARPSAAKRRAAYSTWATISATDRLRTQPACPVAQKAQPTGQPTWVDTQTVLRSG